MDYDPVTESKKRTLGLMLSVELKGKLQSKKDFYVYLDKHRKFQFSFLLIPFQCSFTCPMRDPSTRTSSNSCSERRSSYSRSSRSITSMSLTTMKYPSRHCGLISRRTVNSCNISPTFIHRTRDHPGTIFLTSSTA